MSDIGNQILKNASNTTEEYAEWTWHQASKNDTHIRGPGRSPNTEVTTVH